MNHRLLLLTCVCTAAIAWSSASRADVPAQLSYEDKDFSVSVTRLTLGKDQFKSPIAIVALRFVNKTGTDYQIACRKTCRFGLVSNAEGRSYIPDHTEGLGEFYDGQPLKDSLYLPANSSGFATVHLGMLNALNYVDPGTAFDLTSPTLLAFRKTGPTSLVVDREYAFSIAGVAPAPRTALDGVLDTATQPGSKVGDMLNKGLGALFGKKN